MSGLHRNALLLEGEEMSDHERVEKEIEEAADKVLSEAQSMEISSAEKDSWYLACDLATRIKAALLAQRREGMLDAAGIVAKRRMYESACDATYGTVALQAACGAQLTAALEDIIRTAADELEGE